VSPTDPLSTESLNTEPIRTRRLVLRQWRDSDREPFAELNADPAVMAHFPAPMSRAESDAFVDRISEHFAARGFGLWAVETTEAGSFIGFVGLTVPRFDAHFTPAVEVGWRLARSAWGHGYATVAANALPCGSCRFVLSRRRLRWFAESYPQVSTSQLERSPLNWSFSAIADFGIPRKVTIRSLAASSGTGNCPRSSRRWECWASHAASSW